MCGVALSGESGASMGRVTGIAWCDRTHNWSWGCNEVTPEECGLGLDAGCYARDQARGRFGWHEGGAHPEIWGPPLTTTRRIFGDKHNAEPYLWNAEAMTNDERLCVFAESYADLFEFHPLKVQVRATAFRTVENTPYLDWKMLTKRAQLVRRYVPAPWLEGQWPLNGWIGFSAGQQKYFDQRWEHMADLPAPVIFVSHEPATGPINLAPLARRVDPARLWCITGGMSGPNYRLWPMDEDTARYMRDQCRDLGIAFFFKQHSAFKPGQGAELDGVLHHAWPAVPASLPGKLGGVRKAAAAMAA